MSDQESLHLNRTTVLRLAKYLRVLNKLRTLGFVRVFSNNLGDAVGVTPAVVRKDFSQINVPGNKRGGYNIDTLILELEKVLGKDDEQNLVIVGCGRIGSALMHADSFEKDGLRVVAGFDADPARVDRDAEPPVLPMSELHDYCRANNVRVGVIAVPDSQATAAFDAMIASGIRGLLNFTSVELKCVGKCDRNSCPIQCVVHSVNFSLEIENIFYVLHSQERTLLESLSRVEVGRTGDDI